MGEFHAKPSKIFVQNNKFSRYSHDFSKIILATWLISLNVG